MGKKLTTEYVKDMVEKRGWQFKSDKYVNNSTKFYYICKMGHKNSMDWDHFKRGQECPTCVRERIADTQRHGIEYIRKKFKEREYILKSIEYINAYTNLDYICPNGHKGSMAWHDFQQGTNCPICVNKKRSEKLRHDIEYVRKKYEERGWELESIEYINAHTKLDHICSRGHAGSMTFGNFIAGSDCRVCANEKLSLKFRNDIEYIRAKVEERGWEFKGDKYINNKTKFDFICDKGHKGSMTWDSFRTGCDCLLCYREKLSINMSGEKHPNWKGGISCDPYCDAWADKEYKKSIKERDGYRCQNPYCSCNGGILCIHHIDFNKKNCNPNNLITVCNSCNSFANYDRDWHIAWYQTLMNHKHGYIYV